MSIMTYIINNGRSTALITKQGMSEQLILLEKEKLQDIQELILRMLTNFTNQKKKNAYQFKVPLNFYHYITRLERFSIGFANSFYSTSISRSRC